jgi:macrolide transport system ATP-binding/permease protein
MTILTARHIEKAYGEKGILHDLSFDINKKDRIAIVGNNGAGKTTLASIIYGNVKPDNGMIEYKEEKVTIGFLEQSTNYSVHDYQLRDTNKYHKDFLEVTSELGLTKVHHWETDRFEHVSGGEKLKLALASIWSTNPDILILDEPTNHLDFHGVRWLITQLSSFEGTVIIISHDRYFLDQTVSKIFELEGGSLTIFKGHYSAYRTEKKRRYDEQLHHFEVQQKHKERVDNQVAKLQQWAGKAHSTMRDQEGFKEYHGVKAKKIDRSIKSKMKRLTMELEKNKVEKPVEERKVYFQFEGSGKRGKRVIEAKKLMKHFNGRTLFKDANFYINHGERIGLVGPNGSGKTTLVNMLLRSESVSSGELWKSDSLKVAYLSQDVADLPPSLTPIEALRLTNREDILLARTTLANMGMDEDKINQRIEKLSLGERTRIKLCSMLIEEYDLLILDEPTNHLDLQSREQLEETLLQFNGTIIIISHDVYFLDRLCNKLLVIEDETIKRIELSLLEYEERRKQFSKNEDSSLREELLLIETELSAVIGELSSLTPDHERYIQLDQQFLALTKRKRELKNKA